MIENFLQLQEIKLYDQHLSQETGLQIPLDLAAQIWVRKYARAWRLRWGRKSQSLYDNSSKQGQGATRSQGL